MSSLVIALSMCAHATFAGDRIISAFGRARYLVRMRYVIVVWLFDRARRL